MFVLSHTECHLIIIFPATEQCNIYVTPVETSSITKVSNIVNYLRKLTGTYIIYEKEKISQYYQRTKKGKISDWLKCYKCGWVEIL